ncbi:phosphatidate cytidylyltransferase [Desulfurella sp.]|uniref:phosphatidate cytidylyltransferase n=1 Tax=Desulfurella sp. TaxID=1962857 RepID=UPI0025BC20CF|nr:phosphatidate cytidylyltransferase [Desulfurella sp.]
MIKRIISAGLLIPLVLAIILYAPLWLINLIILMVGLLSYFEWSNFTGLKERYLYFVLTAVFLSTVLFYFEYIFIVLMLIFLIHMIIGFKSIDKNRILTHYYLLGGILYVSLYTFFVNIVKLDNGRWLFLLVCVSIWVGDSFAYFCGKSFGKIKLAPNISPNKTYEGAICGVIFGTISSIMFAYFLNIDLKVAFGVGLVSNMAGIFGDLSESVVKRIYNKKDSSNIIPGHGGMLDRLDSLAFSAYLVYLMFLWKIF